ncbi:MAG: T9SS type A sorting domain-containing protein [Saprospiraceae bacterium]
MKTTPDGVNYNNGDGDGNGKINTVDLDRYLTHYDYKIPGFEKKDKYPQGDDIKIRSNHFYEDGRFTGLQVKSGHAFPPMLGMMFEFEFDTLYYQLRSGTDRKYPLTANMIIPEGSKIISSDYPQRSLDMHYGFVKTNHGSVNIPSEYVFQNFVNGFELKNGISVEDLPDTIVFRIKNIYAVDNNGNDLHLGAQPLIILKNQITGVSPVSITDVSIWPNPCHDSFQVNSDELTDVLIYDIHGKLVKRILASALNKPIDISSLISGVYVLQVQQSGKVYKLIRQ